uniref:Histamine N-methyltransferase n=1 Tax=Oncorhynchus tshawytscha TaxID=74940 RepID=A0AAZ3QWW2_ONCTS
MSYAMRSLVEDDNRYLKSFQLFLECSSEHPCMQDFIHVILPDILASIGEGKANLHVMGVGSGSGEVDLEMFSELRLKHLAVTVDNQVVEPSAQQLHLYKVLVSQKPNLDYIKFTWNKMTATEFEKDWREKNYTKKMDFIHMIQMLYYVKDPCKGKLLIILVSGESGWGKHWKTFKTQLCNTESSHSVTTGDIKTYLDSKTVSYQSYELPSQIDITECFTEGDQRGELLLDFLTEVLNFSSTAPAELKARALELLRHPDCSKEVEGRVIFNNTLGVLVVDPLQ